MDLSERTVVIRHRNFWEAIDLGVMMARRWYRPMLTTWLIVTLPLFLVLHLLPMAWVWLAPAVIWWLKPLFERFHLAFVSSALFESIPTESIPTVRELLSMTRDLLKGDLLRSLTGGRLSGSRSYLLPVAQLEGLRGAERARRAALLSRDGSRQALWLTVALFHLEALLPLMVIVLLQLMTPAQLQVSWLEEVGEEPEKLVLVSNVLWYLSMAVVSPFYASAGFAMYISRRTHLEGWDLELTFRSLATRAEGARALVSLIPALLVVGALTAGPLPAAAAAGVAAQAADRLPAEATEEAVLEAKRRVIRVMAGPEFHQLEPRQNWQLRERQTEEPEEGTSPAARALLETLARIAGIIAAVFEWLLWGGVALLILYLVFRYREWIQDMVEKLTQVQPEFEGPRYVAGMDLEAARDDSPETALEYWRRGDTRGALASLYRGALLELMTEFQLEFQQGYTEAECVSVVTRTSEPSLIDYFRSLTFCWLHQAYADRAPAEAVFRELCDNWPFEKEALDGS